MVESVNVLLEKLEFYRGNLGVAQYRALERFIKGERLTKTDNVAIFRLRRRIEKRKEETEALLFIETILSLRQRRWLRSST